MGATLWITLGYSGTKHLRAVHESPIIWDPPVPRYAARAYRADILRCHSTRVPIEVSVNWYRHWLMRLLGKPVNDQSIFLWEPLLQVWMHQSHGCRLRAATIKEHSMIRQILELSLTPEYCHHAQEHD